MQFVIALPETGETTEDLDRPFGNQPDGNLIAIPTAGNNKEYPQVTDVIKFRQYFLPLLVGW